MNENIFWLIRILSGITIISGWILYHYFNVEFIESIKLVLIGFVVLFLSFYLEEKHSFQEVQHGDKK